MMTMKKILPSWYSPTHWPATHISTNSPAAGIISNFPGWPLSLSMMMKRGEVGDQKEGRKEKEENPGDSIDEEWKEVIDAMSR